MYFIVVLALSTGARKNEILTLKWEHVDFERGVIRLDETKNGDQRSLPLEGHAYDLLCDLFKNRIVSSDYLFPSKTVWKPICIKKSWPRVLRVAKIEDFRFHDLRHTAASYLAMDGASSTDIAEILGHKTLQMVRRYSHLSETHTKKVVASMNSKIFGEGTPVGDKEAVKWFRLAAEQEYAKAQYNMGAMYAKGKGVPQDHEEAVKWFRLAAKQGHSSAQYGIAIAYFEGVGVPQDYKEAVKWSRLAAEQGNLDAQYNLGHSYIYGDGVIENYKEAYAWINIAAISGHKKSIKLKRIMEENIDEKTLIEGQALSKKYSKAIQKNTSE